MEKYMLICTNCGAKHFTDGRDISNLVEVKTAPLPKNANGRSKDTRELPKKFKCFNCGHVFKIVALKVPEQEKKQEETINNEDFMGADGYLKQWENEILKSARMKKPTSDVNTFDPNGDIP